MTPVAVRSAEAEREKLLWAMARVVGRGGFRKASVAEAIAEAKSCRASFDRQFAGKDECFAAAHQLAVGRALEALRAGFKTDRPWREQVEEGLGRAIKLCIANPELARALVLCPAEAGAEGAWCALEMSERFARLIAPPAELAAQLPPRAALMAASGVIGLIGEELADGDGAGLAGLLPELRFALLMPLLGPVAPGEELSRAPAGARA